MSTPSRAAIGAAFVANGLGGPSFLARVPERQADLALTDAELGLVLTGMAVGALAASRWAGRVVGQWGSRPVVAGSAVALAALLWTTAVAATGPVLFAALVAVGAADAAMDIAMNANGAAFERRRGRSVLHGLHAAWSIGALGAALAAAALAGLGVGLAVHLALVGAVQLALLAAAYRGLVADDRHGAVEPADGAVPAARRWRGPAFALGAAVVGGAVLEGAPADWGAVQLDRFGVEGGATALALAGFMTGMVAARLVGDRLTDRFGGAAVLRVGLGLAAAGLTGGLLAADPVVFVAGLTLAGFGAGGFFPLAFSAAGRLPGVAPGAGAAVVSLGARVGFLLEPIVVGAVAGWTSLRWALLLVAGVAAVLAVAVPRLAGRPAPASPQPSRPAARPG